MRFVSFSRQLDPVVATKGTFWSWLPNRLIKLANKNTLDKIVDEEGETRGEEGETAEESEENRPSSQTLMKWTLYGMLQRHRKNPRHNLSNSNAPCAHLI